MVYGATNEQNYVVVHGDETWASLFQTPVEGHEELGRSAAFEADLLQKVIRHMA